MSQISVFFFNTRNFPDRAPNARHHHHIPSPPFKAQWRAFNVGSTACAARVLWQPMLPMAIGDGSSKCCVQGSRELRCVLGIRELSHHPQVSWRNYGGNEEFGSLINHIESKRCKEFWWALSTWMYFFQRWCYEWTLWLFEWFLGWKRTASEFPEKQGRMTSWVVKCLSFKFGSWVVLSGKSKEFTH